MNILVLNVGSSPSGQASLTEGISNRTSAAFASVESAPAVTAINVT